MLIRNLGSQESIASNGTRFGVETKKLWSFEDERAKLRGNFAAEEPFRKVFRSCETTLWHMSATSQRRTPISQLRNGLQKSPPLQNPPLTAEIISKLKKWDAIFFFMFLFSFWLPNGYKNDLQASQCLWKCSKHQNGLRNSHLAAKWFRNPIATPCEILHLLWKWPFDCEMIFQTSKWLWNDFQTSKWAEKKFFFFPFGFEMAKKWFVKTPYKAKGSCKNANRASQPCI